MHHQLQAIIYLGVQDVNSITVRPASIAACQRGFFCRQRRRDGGGSIAQGKRLEEPDYAKTVSAQSRPSGAGALRVFRKRTGVAPRHAEFQTDHGGIPVET